MEDFDDEFGYDGTDDNIEILLEDAMEDQNQAYLYIRIRKNPGDYKLIEQDEYGHTANCDEFTILSSGSVDQFAVMFLQLFEMDETYIDAVAAAVKAYQEFKSRNN